MRSIHLKACSFCVVALSLLATGCGTVTSPTNNPLTLADEGSFFVGGTVKDAIIPATPVAPATPGKLIVGQMYVQYRIPANTGTAPRKFPLVFVHGGGLTGSSYETTPDGREGWATYFTKKGYSTYVVDIPGRGRSGFDATKLPDVKVGQISLETSWKAYRFGPRFKESFPGLQYPVAAIEAFGAQGVPLSEVTIEGGATPSTAAALAALVDRIGPAIIMVHSQAGPSADALVGLRKDKVKAVINVEGSQLIRPSDAQILAYKNIPVMELYGDYLLDDPTGFVGLPRYTARKEVVGRINAAGGRAQIIQLPDLGIRGNSHFPMQDKNNLQVADVVLKWLDENVK